MKNLYEDIANKAAEIIGFSQTDIETFDRSKSSLFANSFSGGESLSNYLNYRYFDEATQNFLLESSSAGFMLEISPLVGVDDKIVKNLNQFFAKELPPGGFLQFLLLASSDIDDFLNHWSAGRSNPDPIVQRITRERSSYLRSKAANFTASGYKLPRHFKIYVSYSSSFRNCNEAALANLSAFRKVLFSKLDSLKLQPRICQTNDLVRLCREILEFSPNSKPNYKPLSKHDLVNNQCLSNGHYYMSKKRHFLNSKTNIAHRSFNISSMPSFWSLLQNINLLGDSAKAPLPARFLISYSIANDHKTKRAFTARGTQVIEAAERPYNRHNKTLHLEAAEWREIIHRLTTEDNILSDSWSLILSADENHIDDVCSKVLSQYGGLDWNLNPLDYFHLESILGSLPMHAANYWYDLRSKKMVHPVLSSEVVSKLPIHGEWYGVPMSGVPFIGRRGQIFNWNPYHRIASGNYNINVVGPSGVGKSVLLQCLADAMLASGSRLFVLDIGGSYAPQAKLLGGEIIEFGALSSYTINPFSGLTKEMSEKDLNELIICAKELVSIMCGAQGEFEAASLEKAIKDAAIKSNFELDLKYFVSFLKESESELLNRFATSLFSYTPEGVFGKYFSGEKPANFDKQMTIFEFEHVKDQPKLISIILQTLLMQITSQFLTGDRSQKFMIIVDEAWHLLDFAAGFLAAIARNLRRYGGSLVVCTQCFADLQTLGKTEENNGHRQAIYQNSAWKVILPQDSTTDFEAHSDFKEKIPLLKSLSFERGEYSEMLLSSSGIDVVGRLILDEFSASVFSTESEDFNFIARQEAQNIPMEQIMDNLIKAKKDARRQRQ